VAVVVTTWNGHFLERTLEHLPPDVHRIVIDVRANRWPLSRAWNSGIDRLLWQRFEAVVVMNDDVIVRPDTVDLLAWGILEGQHDVRYHSSWGDRKPHLLLLSARHASLSDACTDEPDWALLSAAQPEWQPGPDFAMFAVTRELFERVGRFDEGFDPAWFEDNDMHRRIQLAGYEAGAFAPYWHFRNGTVRTDPERLAVAHNGGFERSKQHYIEKWGGPLGQERYTTPFDRRPA
jgi:hypothetical protein